MRPMAERIEFDIIAKRGSCEDRVWTNGALIQWDSRDEESDSGFIPRRLFLLACHALAERCEEMSEDRPLFEAAIEAMCQPITIAMAYPIGMHNEDDDDRTASDAVKFGFDSAAVATSIDAQPTCLRPRGPIVG